MDTDPVLAEILASDQGAKKKVKAIAEALLGGEVEPAACTRAASDLAEADRGTVLESLELASRTRPQLVDADIFAGLLTYLADPAPRPRWEAARAIANVAALHGEQLPEAVDALLPNTAHEGSVVRWATAHALVAVLRAGYAEDGLVSKLRAVAAHEQDDGVKGVYDKGLPRLPPA